MLTPLPLSSPRGPGANERRPVGLVPAMRTQQENLWRSYPARHAHLPGSRGKRRKARPWRNGRPAGPLELWSGRRPRNNS